MRTARTSTSATPCPTSTQRRSAGARAVGVATGPVAADELRAGGADVVLDTLAEFPAWLATIG